MAQEIDRLKGTMSSFNGRRGFGFITPEDGVEDLFVHHSSIDEFAEFSVDVGDDGRTRADCVTCLGCASIQCASYCSGGHPYPCFICCKVGHLTRSCFLENGGRCGVVEDEVQEDVVELPAGEQSNWAELTRDVLSVIFKKIAAIEIIRSAQFVCKSWRHLSHEPELWSCIEMTGHADLLNIIDRNTLAMEAVRRSNGCLEEFHGEYVGNNELMFFMADRATLLRCLHLTEAHEMSDEVLVHALKKFPLLEELELTFCSFYYKIVELVGQTCPHLKTFGLNEQSYMFYDDYESELELNHDSKALAIAKHMQQLRCLKLIGNRLTNDGLTAILDNCPYLQHLDIRRCLHVNLDETLKKKLSRIKVVKLPNDSTADCLFDTIILEPRYGFEYGDDYYDNDP